MIQPELEEFQKTSEECEDDVEVDLQAMCEKSGLQVIAELQEIELNPQQPVYESNEWSVDGMMVRSSNNPASILPFYTHQPHFQPPKHANINTSRMNISSLPRSTHSLFTTSHRPTSPFVNNFPSELLKNSTHQETTTTGSVRSTVSKIELQ